MNTSQKLICSHIAQSQPASFAELSFATRMATDFLSCALDDLETRGFVRRNGDKYMLQPGVRAAILNEPT